MPLNHGTGHMPVLGFGTLIPDAAATISATRDALEAGFRHFDCAERYRNEREVGEALQGRTCRWGDRARRHFRYHKVVELQSSARARRTGFRGESGQTRAHVSGSLPHSHSVCISTGGRAGSAGSKRQCPLRQRSDFARYLESDGKSGGSRGRCRAIGLSDIGLNELLPIYEAARIKPAVVQVESHPYLPETELLEFCKEKGVVFLAFAPLGHGIRPGPLEDPVILAIAARVGKTPAQVLLAWAVQRGTALLTTPRTAARARENFDISALPEDAFDEINRIQTRQRLNEVVKTGVPGFIHKVHNMNRQTGIGAVYARGTNT
jgi:alcohol dehydrogenase (NADP+)